MMAEVKKPTHAGTELQKPPHLEVLWSANGLVVPRDSIPTVSPVEFHHNCIEAVSQGARLAAMLVLPPVNNSPDSPQGILAVLADDTPGRIGLIRMLVPKERSYESLSAVLPQAQAFEREIYELHGIRPAGHSWLKPLRRHSELESPAEQIGSEHNPYRFFRVEGEGIHEVAVGPVHAGIIEPGHFRFQCHGETVLSLEIQLGYQHRGAEALLVDSRPARRLAIAESIAGDTVIGHGLACCRAIEALAGVEAPLYAQALRGIALELERLSNHVGDLGALCNDVGYLPGASWLGRLRGEFLNLLMEMSASRYGRSLIKPGGVLSGLTASQRIDILSRLARAERDFEATAELIFDTPSIGSRFEHTGVVTHDVAQELGLVGPIARASGCSRDVRHDHPFDIFRFAHIPVAVTESGDVMGRALVHWLEAQRSVTFVREQISELSDSPLWSDVNGARANSLVVSLVEGWRGEIVHIAVTDQNGQLCGYKIIDPSFHNWPGLAFALRGEQISDFPLCNKSFNLSYAGHDL
jgi:Ni,Fe-hydrogenase III large subunit